MHRARGVGTRPRVLQSVGFRHGMWNIRLICIECRRSKWFKRLTLQMALKGPDSVLSGEPDPLSWSNGGPGWASGLLLAFGLQRQSGERLGVSAGLKHRVCHSLNLVDTTE